VAAEDVDVSPEAPAEIAKAIAAALEHLRPGDPSESAWWRAGLAESVRGEPNGD